MFHHVELCLLMECHVSLFFLLTLSEAGHILERERMSPYLEWILDMAGHAGNKITTKLHSHNIAITCWQCYYYYYYYDYYYYYYYYYTTLQ